MSNFFNIESFKQGFFQLTEGHTWQIQGFVDQNNNVFPIDTDTKVISTVFERLASPVLRTLASSKGYVVETANQTTYPDFTVTKYDESGAVLHRIAVDIKTTYISPQKNKPHLFKKTKLTLGSYKSFIRNNTKNILYPYNTYTEHWILGYVYSRGVEFEEYDLSNMPTRGDIRCPYNVLSVFLRDKIDITGIKPGSGNTANIGSVEISEPNEFNFINGPFTQFSDKKGACNKYWCGFENYKAVITNHASLFAHSDFQEFK